MNARPAKPSQSDVLLSAARALWEVPTPGLRAVAVGWDEQWVRPRFIYEDEPSDEERELVSLFGTHLVADFSNHKVEERVEVVPSSARLELLDGEAWVYLRHER